MNGMIQDKLETALVALVTTAAGTLAVYPGKSSEEKAIPCVVCSAEVADSEDPKGTGNFPATCMVAVKQSAVQNEDGTDATAASPKATSQAIAAAIFDAVMIDTLAASLTAATDDLTVFSGSVHFTAAQSGRDESGIWVDNLTFSCLACGSSLS